MPAPRIAVCLRSLNLPLVRAAARVRALGLRAVEIDARRDVRPQELSESGLRQIRKLLADYELSVAAVEFPTRRGYGTTDELDRRIEATKAALRMARALGCDLVVNRVGRVPADLTQGEGAVLVEVLRDLGHFSQHAGAWLAAESGEDDPADLRRLLDALPPASLFVTLDSGRTVLGGHSLRATVELLGEAVRHVHACDAVRELGGRGGVETSLGRGAVDFPDLLGALEERGYRGYLSIACEPSNDAEAEIARGIEYLNHL